MDLGETSLTTVPEELESQRALRRVLTIAVGFVVLLLLVALYYALRESRSPERMAKGYLNVPYQYKVIRFEGLPESDYVDVWMTAPTGVKPWEGVVMVYENCGFVTKHPTPKKGITRISGKVETRQVMVEYLSGAGEYHVRIEKWP